MPAKALPSPMTLRVPTFRLEQQLGYSIANPEVVFDYPCGQEILVFSQTVRPIVGACPTSFNGCRGWGVCPGGETDHSPSSVEVNCVYSCSANLVVSVNNPRDRLRHCSKNNSAFSGSASMSSLSRLFRALARCHKVFGCGSYGTRFVCSFARAEIRCEAALK